MASAAPCGSKPLSGFGVGLTLLGLIGLGCLAFKSRNELHRFAHSKTAQVQMAEQHQDQTTTRLSVIAVALGLVLTGAGSSYGRS